MFAGPRAAIRVPTRLAARPLQRIFAVKSEPAKRKIPKPLAIALGVDACLVILVFGMIVLIESEAG